MKPHRKPPITQRALSLLALSASAPLWAAGFNDTGQSLCYDNSGATIACGDDSSAYPGQDGRYGRDVASPTKIGGGLLGFDFTKLDINGNPLAIQNVAWAVDGSGFDSGSEGAGSKWACVKDNHTGLIWEVKTNLSTTDLRDKDYLYTWYNSNSATNGGNAGLGDTGAGVGSDSCFDSARCDTEKYIEDLNALNLCGETSNDWRLPTRQELMGIVRYGTNSPAIDASYFPNAISSAYWTAETRTKEHPSYAAYAWYVSFSDGSIYHNAKSVAFFVRPVRGGQ